jgi:exodeoxyribonuclease-5
MPITIEINGIEISLSPDQEQALAVCMDELTANGEAVLAGAAGTGKTTVMRAVLDGWDGSVLFLAPTGKAAVRLAESTQRKAHTIHSAIFGSVEESQDEGKEILTFGELHPPKGCNASTLVVVDEASMVTAELGKQLREALGQVGAKVLWVGDHEQLPPVDGRAGVDLANATAKLTTVHRQALESPVLEFATMIRENRMGEFDNWGGDVTKQLVNVQDAAMWRGADDSRVLLTWTNRVRKQANEIIRAGRGLDRGEASIGETLICTFNNHNLGLMNGETFEVESIREHEDLSEVCGQPIVWVKALGRTKEFLMAPESFDMTKPDTYNANRAMSDRNVYRSVWANLFARGPAFYSLLESVGITQKRFRTIRSEAMEWGVQGTWGYCLTVHKSQGSQWKEVGFMSCPGFRSRGGFLSLDDKKRMLYTAVTRAESRVHIFTLNA